MRRLFQLLLLSLCSYPQCPAEGAQAYETSPAWVGNDAHIESQRFAPHQRYELIPYYYLAHLAYDAGELKAGVQDLQCRRHLSGWMPSLPVRRAVIGAPAEAYPVTGETRPHSCVADGIIRTFKGFAILICAILRLDTR